MASAGQRRLVAEVAQWEVPGYMSTILALAYLLLRQQAIRADLLPERYLRLNNT